MFFYCSKKIEIVESTVVGKRSYIQLTGVSYIGDLKMITAREDLKKFIEQIEIGKSTSSFRITCLEEGEEQITDVFDGLEVKVKISQHKEYKNSTIDYVTVFSNTRYKKIMHEFMLCSDSAIEFDMPEIEKFKIIEDDEYIECEIKASLHSYKFSLANKINRF